MKKVLLVLLVLVLGLTSCVEEEDSYESPCYPNDVVWILYENPTPINRGWPTSCLRSLSGTAESLSERNEFGTIVYRVTFIGDCSKVVGTHILSKAQYDTLEVGDDYEFEVPCDVNIKYVGAVEYHQR